jgi:hypothetical protein
MPDINLDQIDFPHAMIRRLDPCPCGSLKRFKDCHGSLGRDHRVEQALELRRTGHRQEAKRLIDVVLAETPDVAIAWNVLGLLQQDQHELADAIGSYRHALLLASEMPQAHVNLAHSLLLQRNYADGWREYEWRTRAPGYADYAHYPFGIPRWKGEPLSERSLLVHAEQGQGDTLQFARFIPRLAAQGVTIDVFCQPPLVSLMQGLEGVRRVTSDLVERPDQDFHAPIVDLAAHFLRSPDDDHWFGAYIHPEPELAAKWRTMFSKLPGLRIGLAWQGSRKHTNDHNRSIAVDRIMGLQVPGVSLVSLQVEQASDAIAKLGLFDAGNRFEGWEDTAAAASQLDHVVTVDSAVAHLSGAMGIPVWVLVPFSPDWRWGLASDETPWYPSMKLFRQRAPGDWDGVIERVRAALAEQVRSHQ